MLSPTPWLSESAAIFTTESESGKCTRPLMKVWCHDNFDFLFVNPKFQQQGFWKNPLMKRINRRTWQKKNKKNSKIFMYICITSVDTNSKANLKKHKSFRDNTTQQHINTMSTEKCFYHKDLLIIFCFLWYLRIFFQCQSYPVIGIIFDHNFFNSCQTDFVLDSLRK